MLSDEQCLRIYTEATGDPWARRDEREQRSIVEEMRSVIGAPDLAEASDVIAWWHCGGERRLALRIRRLAGVRDSTQLHDCPHCRCDESHEGETEADDD